MIASVSAATELPAAGTPMFLVLGEGMNFRTRLESVDGDTFTVAGPLETAGPAPLTCDHRLDVFWATPRTRIVQPARLIAVAGEAPFRWTLTPAGPSHKSDRREHVRGGGGAAVRLTADGCDVEGALLDISEGGLRCWVDEPAALAPGDQLRVGVRLGAAGEIELSGTVLTVREAPHGDPGRHVVLTFGAAEGSAELIRQYVTNWELTERP